MVLSLHVALLTSERGVWLEFSSREQLLFSWRMTEDSLELPRHCQVPAGGAGLITSTSFKRTGFDVSCPCSHQHTLLHPRFPHAAQLRRDFLASLLRWRQEAGRRVLNLPLRLCPGLTARDEGDRWDRFPSRWLPSASRHGDSSCPPAHRRLPSLSPAGISPPGGPAAWTSGAARLGAAPRLR